jgi:hypothetical protein
MLILGDASGAAVLAAGLLDPLECVFFLGAFLGAFFTVFLGAFLIVLIGVRLVGDLATVPGFLVSAPTALLRDGIASIPIISSISNLFILMKDKSPLAMSK